MDRTELAEEEFEPRRTWGGKIAEMLNMRSRHDEEEDEWEEEPQPQRSITPGSRQMLRVESARPHAIYFRRAIHSMEDASAAADRLKERRPVICNFEHTDPEVAKRVVDFISGVTYALDGFWQRVGDKVFLFTPSNTAIAIEEEDGYGSEANSGLYEGR
jgi:cell division inhibitor SepF